MILICNCIVLSYTILPSFTCARDGIAISIAEAINKRFINRNYCFVKTNQAAIGNKLSYLGLTLINVNGANKPAIEWLNLFLNEQSTKHICEQS